MKKEEAFNRLQYFIDNHRSGLKYNGRDRNAFFLNRLWMLCLLYKPWEGGKAKGMDRLRAKHPGDCFWDRDVIKNNHSVGISMIDLKKWRECNYKK